MDRHHQGAVPGAARRRARRRLGVLALVLLLGQPPTAQAACDPSVSCCAGAPAAGSPCGGAGVATLGNTSGVDSGAGNPLNVLGGNKFQREVDMPALPGVLGLELVRYYNSADSERHLLGRGWRLSYETTLRVGTGALAGTLEVVQADGTRIAFALPPDERQDPGQGQGDLYRGLSPLHGLVHRLHTPRGSEYLWRWADGRQLRFNTTGQLEQVRVPSGEFLSLRYDGRGWLSEVIDPAGRRLRLHVLDKAGAQDPQRYRGVQGIDTPVGRFVYEHGGQLPEGSSARPSEPIANLTRVIFPGPGPSEGATPPSTLARLYHYEDPRLPNGPNANPEDSDITRYGWDARADHLQRIVRPGPRTLHVHREPESGRIVGVTGPDGVTVPLPQATRGNAGLSDNADLNGNAGPSGKADLLIEHDPWARPVAWRTVAGAASGTASGDGSEALLSATWGPAGSVAESSVLGFATPHAQAQRRLDDFARVVAIRHPGQGWRFARHDEAGRLLETIDPRGARQRARWDLAGRLTRLERFAPGADPDTTAEQVIDRRYEHERLIEERLSDRQGQRITRLSYDARGALASETLRIEPAGALRAALPEPIQLGQGFVKARWAFSYGSTQFVVSTFVDRMLTFSDVRKLSTNPNLVYQTLFNSQANLSEEEKKALGLIDAQGQDTGLRQRLGPGDDAFHFRQMMRASFAAHKAGNVDEESQYATEVEPFLYTSRYLPRAVVKRIWAEEAQRAGVDLAFPYAD